MTGYLMLSIYLLCLNLAAFFAMGADKRRAKRHAWRISERTLLLLALPGGALGAWTGMLVFRHKTKHWYFRFGLPLFAVVQVLVVIFLSYTADYYHADQTALYALRGTDSVAVSRENGGYFFDGPGDNTALVFYPGGKVEYTAYAPLMACMAERGVDCFLVKMPLNLAVFGTDRAGGIMAAHRYGHWYLGGHSLGGAIAASYASGHLEALDGLVLLGAYPTGPLQAEGFRVLSAYGSEDRVLNREKLLAGMAYLPRDSTELCIEGGNHAWFGSYGEQAGDGKASISHEAQWIQTADAAAAMMLH